MIAVALRHLYTTIVPSPPDQSRLPVPLYNPGLTRSEAHDASILGTEVYPSELWSLRKLAPYHVHNNTANNDVMDWLRNDCQDGGSTVLRLGRCMWSPSEQESECRAA